ncbi:transposable element Tcb1 transposase [Trichonephila clavipes]|nr:transposable element Tcb1 transposase [Trichonephila clavipes]
MLAEEWKDIIFTDESRICLQHREGRIRVWRHRGERMQKSCVMHCHTGPKPLLCQRYISEVFQPVFLPYLQGLATVIFQQDNVRPHVSRVVQSFYVNHQIELLLWLARSIVLSPTENMWSMVVQRLTQITPPPATPDQVWQRVEAVWSAVPQENMQNIFESMPRRVAAVISINGSFSGY